MSTYDRRTRVRAPLEEVWDFHSRVSGLETLTPVWMELRVEAVVGPDGESNPEILEPGSEISLSIRPGGVGPRQGWTSRIVDRERESGAAYFRDEMVEGPFDRWTHTHTFYADGDATVVRDRVEYDLPCGPLGDAIGPLAWVGFEPLFRTRHERTKEALEERSGRGSRHVSP